MYHRLLTILILFGISLTTGILHCTPVMAKIFALEAIASGKTAADQLTVSLKVRNKGHENIHNVEATFYIFGNPEKVPLKSHLAAQESFVFYYRKKISAHAKGRYPFTIIIDFQDMNNHNFSAVSYGTFFIKKDAPSALACSADDLFMEEKGTLIFHLKNLGPDKKYVKATLVLPRGLSACRQKKHLEIDPWSEEKLEFKITNLSSSSKGTYPIAFFLEYEFEKVHYTTFHETSIKTAKKGSHYIRGLQLACIIVGVVICVAFLGYRWKAKGYM